MRINHQIIGPRKFLMFVNYPSRWDARLGVGEWADKDKAEREEYTKKARKYEFELIEMDAFELEKEINNCWIIEQEHWDQLDWEISEHGNTKRHEYWSANSYWTLEESIFLLLGKEPELFSFEEIKTYKIGSIFAKKLIELETMIHRSSVIGEISYPIHPLAILEWCKKRRIPFPRELGDLVELIYNNEKDNSKKVAMDADLGPRERESLLKIVIAMAVKGYSYVPKATRSQTPKEISDDMALMGLSLSDDTIRKYLNEAAELLPPKDSL